LAASLEKYLSTGTVPEKQAVYGLLADSADPGADRLLAQQLNALLADQVAGAIQLDLLEAAGKRNDPQVKAAFAQFTAQRAGKSGVELFAECLTGGNAATGQKIFHDKIEASCIRCHKVTGEGGDAGPNLSQIGARADRAYILESITYPNNKIAPGFENVQGVLNNGVSYAGLLKNETPETIELFSPEDGLVTIKKSDIKTRTRGLSGMLDNMREMLTKREIRDLVEYLSTLK
jgi:quinoprotein glucose dehydrogenase